MKMLVGLTKVALIGVLLFSAIALMITWGVLEASGPDPECPPADTPEPTPTDTNAITLSDISTSDDDGIMIAPIVIGCGLMLVFVLVSLGLRGKDE